MTAVLAGALLGSTAALARPVEIRKTGMAHSKVAPAGRSKKTLKKKTENKKAERPGFPRSNNKLASRR
jgi:hypothetical protein